jgi:serine protease
MPIKVLDSSGSGYVSDIADGIYYAADNGCQVINMSLGGNIGSTTLQNAVQYAYNKGVTIVCAAGNAGTSTPQYPAAYSECISVSAVRYDDTITDYSSYGSTIDICAPGGDVSVDQNGDGYGDGVLQQTHADGNPTDFGYYFYEGTSMASPHVAGVAAMVIAAGGGSMSPDDVRAVLEGTATDLGASGWDQYYGHGKVNAYDAVLEAQGGGNPPVAQFSGSPTSGEAPLTVYFTDESTNNPTSWSWDFGDGYTSTAQNPSHEYSSAGTYTVELTAANADGSDTETKVDYITVTEPGSAPVADFTGSPTSGDAPLTVNFTDQSTGSPTSWSWDFGDGYTSTAQNPTHEYGSAGTYTVELTASNAYGSDTETKVDYITVTEAPAYSMHVSSIEVWRQSWWFFRRGAARVTIVDQNNNPVSGATVYGDFTGPTSGSRSGSTDSNGQVTLVSSYSWGASGEWCFEVTNVTKSGWTYDSAANAVTKSCESGDVFKVSKEEMFAGEDMPAVYQLFQNYPNPFNPVTRIAFSLPENSHVTVNIYNVNGELVENLVDRNLEAGIHNFEWNASGVVSGVYFYRLTAGQFVQTRKMVLMR